MNDIRFRPADLFNYDELKTIALIHESAPQNWIENYKIEEKNIQRRVDYLYGKNNLIEIYVDIAVNNLGSIIGLHWIDILENNGDRFCQIMSLYVGPEYRKQGFATMLKKRGENWAKNNGFNCLRTNISYRNENIMGLNLKLGYQVESLKMIKYL